MAILNVGNTNRDLNGPSTYHETNTARFDPAYSPRGMGVIHGRIDNAGNAPRQHMRWDAPTGDLWIHFRCRMPGWASEGSNDGLWLRLRDGSGRLLAQINQDNSNLQAQVYDGSTSVFGALWDPPDFEVATYDIRVSVGANIEMDVYRNQVLVSSATMVNSNRTAPTDLYFEHWDWTNATAGERTVYSELIVTDAESTLGWRLAALDPVSIGFHTGFSADVQSFVDLNVGPRVQAQAVGERMSWLPSAYGGAPTPTNIRAVVAKAIGRVGSTGPSQLAQFLRIAGTDYDGAAQTLNSQMQGNIEVWDNNPDTVASWAVADLAAMEVGILSAT